jgi:hypothetical protein
VRKEIIELNIRIYESGGGGRAHGVISQKMAFFIVTYVKTTNINRINQLGSVAKT